MKINEKQYAEITNQIIASLQQGRIPWQRPWDAATGFVSHATGKRYSLLNSMILANTIGKEGEYATYLGAKAENGFVRRGAKSAKIWLWKQFKRTEIVQDENGNDIKQERIIPMLRSYNVFHLSDIEGIEPKHPCVSAHANDPIESAESILHSYLKREGINFHSDSKVTEAYFSESRNLIEVPTLAHHHSAAEYYSTCYHEAAHSTGTQARLKRFLPGERGKLYAREELVAEMTSWFILSSLGIDTSATHKNSTAYIQSWLRRLSDDPSMIVWASSRAERAVEYILNGSID